MNCVIIEDEIAGQEILKIKLAKLFPSICILKIISKKEDAINYLIDNQNDIDFIFLDIEIQGGSGIHVIEAIENRKFEVIVTTAYEEYAIDSFRLNAIHYLLKPYNDQDLQEAINRIYAKNNSRHVNEFISIPFKNEILRINYNEIVYCKSDGSYTEIFLENKKHLSSKSIGEIEKSLDDRIFVRVHHSYIINKTKIEKIEKGRSGTLFLKGEHSIPISQRKMNDFLTNL